MTPPSEWSMLFNEAAALERPIAEEFMEHNGPAVHGPYRRRRTPGFLSRWGYEVVFGAAVVINLAYWLLVH